MNIIQSKEGWWGIQSDTHVFKWICETGKLDHDEFLIPIACDNIPVGGVVIDAGALYGDHSVAYARKIGPTGALFCVEANRLAFECLVRNAEKFECPVFCMNVALGEKHGQEAVHVMDENNIGASRVHEKNGSKIETFVRTASVDGIVTDSMIDRLDFIKIDCEGWEYKILLGAKKTIETLKPKMLIEMNSFSLSLQDSSYKDIYDFLLGMGYDWRIVQPDCKGGDTQYDVMAWPKT